MYTKGVSLYWCLCVNVWLSVSCSIPTAFFYLCLSYGFRIEVANRIHSSKYSLVEVVSELVFVFVHSNIGACIDKSNKPSEIEIDKIWSFRFIVGKKNTHTNLPLCQSITHHTLLKISLLLRMYANQRYNLLLIFFSHTSSSFFLFVHIFLSFFSFLHKIVINIKYAVAVMLNTIACICSGIPVWFW